MYSRLQDADITAMQTDYFRNYFAWSNSCMTAGQHIGVCFKTNRRNEAGVILDSLPIIPPGFKSCLRLEGSITIAYSYMEVTAIQSEFFIIALYSLLLTVVVIVFIHCSAKFKKALWS